MAYEHWDGTRLTGEPNTPQVDPRVQRFAIYEASLSVDFK